MGMLFPIMLIVVVVFILAFVGGHGFWSNLIMFVNVLLAGLVATNYFEPVAYWLTEKYNPLTMFADYMAFWGIFTFTYALLLATTGAASRVKVKTISAVDTGLGYLMAVATGWLMICLVCASMHLAPLTRTILFGGFRPEDPCFFGMSPDRTWFAFNQKLSMGALGWNPPEDDPEKYVFDADGDMMLRYAARRHAYGFSDGLSGLEGVQTVPLGIDPAGP